MYNVKISDKVIKELDKISDKDYSKIRNKILSLELNPKPIGSLKLKGEFGFRIRMGDYRILYEVDDINKIVNIYKVEHRKDVYRKR